MKRVRTLLPLVLLAAMLVVGLGIEAVRFGTVEWWPKLPLVVLLAWSFLGVGRKVRGRSTGSSRA